MLQLKNIVKTYVMGDTRVEALKGVDLEFRKNDFVSILGPSGCGKTTMLNIIGGLDRYTSGDLVINGTSTKEYKDVDWDIYRNNSIGFVFQTYNLIAHQTVFSNVELALTLAGITPAERKQRVVDVLEKVGLSDQIHKKPNQMSGGQMQRVAIARALVNNPEILLADEPTGALDSETSVQIMELLKEIAKDRLVIMVTHNGDIAEKYSTRIIRLLDGKVIGDTNPYSAEQEAIKKDKKKRKKISMSFPTALSLSFKNLLTKKTRTILTAFAGSIGIIGIALILSLSSGMQTYVNNLERDTLSTYPLVIQSQSMDMGSMMTTMMGANNRGGITHDLDNVYSNNVMTEMIESMSSRITKNDLRRFKEYIESEDGKRLDDLTNSIQYGYAVDLHIFKSDTSDGAVQVNPGSVMDSIGMGGGMGGSDMGSMGAMGGMGNTWTELINNDELLKAQYDVLAGKWPEAYNEVVLVVDENNEISDMNLYSLGLMDAGDLEAMITKVMKGEDIGETETAVFSYDEILSLTFKLVLNTAYYEKQEEGEMSRWVDMSEDADFMKKLVDNGIDIKVVGILRPSEDAAAASIGGTVGYTAALTEYVINAINDSEIAKEQVADPEKNIFTGFVFDIEGFIENMTVEDMNEMVADMSEEQMAQFNEMTEGKTDEEILAMFSDMAREQLIQAGELDTYESNCEKLGIVDHANPSSISLYPKDFTSKEKIVDMIKDYNKAHEDAGRDEYIIRYTDIVGLMTSGISSMINIVSYVLIAFVAISLIVSSIMIAIITYISVLERTKEIGILRSIGASKKDITRVFNAETIIEGLVAGALGVGITLLLNIPINIIIKSLAGISGISALPVAGAVGLIVLSIVLTVIAGFIPSKMAAKKDPVVALRTE